MVRKISEELFNLGYNTQVRYCSPRTVANSGHFVYYDIESDVDNA